VITVNSIVRILRKFVNIVLYEYVLNCLGLVWISQFRTYVRGGLGIVPGPFAIIAFLESYAGFL